MAEGDACKGAEWVGEGERERERERNARLRSSRRALGLFPPSSKAAAAAAAAAAALFPPVLPTHWSVRPTVLPNPPPAGATIAAAAALPPFGFGQYYTCLRFPLLASADERRRVRRPAGRGHRLLPMSNASGGGVVRIASKFCSVVVVRVAERSCSESSQFVPETTDCALEESEGERGREGRECGV